MSAVNPLVVMLKAQRPMSYESRDYMDMHDAIAAVEALVMKADAIAATLELPGYAKQSNKNANAGFIDWRDWCALLGEVSALRAAIAPFVELP